MELKSGDLFFDNKFLREAKKVKGVIKKGHSKLFLCWLGRRAE